jgi:hypothetical protein
VVFVAGSDCARRCDPNHPVGRELCRGCRILLVTQNTALDLNRAALRFVEMKYDLRREFNHSFAKLAAVICWDTKLANEDVVVDLTGAPRTMKITSPKSDASLRYTKYMLVSDTVAHNIEVFVLKDFLAECLKMDFRPRTKSSARAAE